MSASQIFQHTSSSGLISTCTISSKKVISFDDSGGSGFELEKEVATKGQANGKTTSVVDLLETLPVLLGIVIEGYSLSLHSGQVRFSLVRLWSTPSLRMTVWFSFGMSLHSGLPLSLTSGTSLHSGLLVGLVHGTSLLSG